MTGHDQKGVNHHCFVDATGLICPMPLLKAKKALNALASTEILLVQSTDPSSMRDFAVFARQSGHSLLEARQEGALYTYRLQKT